MKQLSIFFLLLVLFGLTQCKKENEEELPLACLQSDKFQIYSYDSIEITNCSQKAASISIDFGDGTTSTLAPVYHRYSSGGLYKIILTAYSPSKSKKDTASITLEVIEKHDLALISTDYGNILIWLYNETPLHKANFLNLANTGFYDSLTFHRVIDGFVIQGGDPKGDGTGGPGYDIPAEFHDSLTHVYGAVAAARLSDAVNPERKSSGSQFYIVEPKTGYHSLDTKYTVFGIVVDGMTAVEAIAIVPKDANNKPLQPVYMKKVEVVQYTTKQLLDTYQFKVPKYNK